MSHKPDTSSEGLEFWPSTKKVRETHDRVEKDFEHRSAEAVREALGKGTCRR